VGGWRSTLFGGRRPWPRVRSPKGDGGIGSRLLHATAVKAAAHGRHPFEGFLLTQLEVCSASSRVVGERPRRWCSSSAARGLLLQMDMTALGRSAPDLSAALADHKLAATPMTAWGERVARRYIRFVYSREPVQRLSQLEGRLRAALEQLS
jgi:hypothetical protein